MAHRTLSAAVWTLAAFATNANSAIAAGPNTGEAKLRRKEPVFLWSDCSKRITIDYRIITNDTPRARDLHGKLRISAIGGDPAVLRITRPTQGAPFGLTLPYAIGTPVRVVVQGHFGGGIHDWHNGREDFYFHARKIGSVLLEASLDPDPEFPEGDGGPTLVARFRVVVPEAKSITWEYPTRAVPLPWEHVIRRGEPITLALKTAPAALPITVVGDAPCRVRLYTIGAWIPAHGTRATGVDVPVDPQGVALDPASNVVRITLPHSELIRHGLLPAGRDAVDEFASADFVADPQQSSYRDSDAFEQQLAHFRVVQRGKARTNLMGLDGDMRATPPEASCERTFMQAAGVERIFAEVATARSEARLVQNQADIFYFSGHGYHATGGLSIAPAVINIKLPWVSGWVPVLWAAQFTPAEARAFWSEDVSTVIFAGCSVLDIKNYNGNVFSGGAGNASPGELWIGTGPKVFLGYSWIAPLDAQLGNPGYTRDIVLAYLALRARGVPESRAWITANSRAVPAGTVHTRRDGRPLNCCAV